MNKVLLIGAFSLMPNLCFAFDGELQFSKKERGITHTLKVKNWKIDNKNTPSFDYVYSHTGATCKYEIQGRAQALMEDNGEPTVMNGSGPDDEPQVIPFYDDKTQVDFSFPYKKKKEGEYMAFMKTFAAAMLKDTCVKKVGLFEVSFFKTKK